MERFPRSKSDTDMSFWISEAMMASLFFGLIATLQEVDLSGLSKTAIQTVFAFIAIFLAAAIFLLWRHTNREREKLMNKRDQAFEDFIEYLKKQAEK